MRINSDGKEKKNSRLIKKKKGVKEAGGEKNC